MHFFNVEKVETEDVLHRKRKTGISLKLQSLWVYLETGYKVKYYKGELKKKKKKKNKNKKNNYSTVLAIVSHFYYPYLILLCLHWKPIGCVRHRTREVCQFYEYPCFYM